MLTPIKYQSQNHLIGHAMLTNSRCMHEIGRYSRLMLALLKQESNRFVVKKRIGRENGAVQRNRTFFNVDIS